MHVFTHKEQYGSQCAIVHSLDREGDLYIFSLAVWLALFGLVVAVHCMVRTCERSGVERRRGRRRRQGTLLGEARRAEARRSRAWLSQQQHPVTSDSTKLGSNTFTLHAPIHNLNSMHTEIYLQTESLLYSTVVFNLPGWHQYANLVFLPSLLKRLYSLLCKTDRL